MSGLSPATTLHVVAPSSLRSWFRFFVDDPGGLDRIFHAGESSGLRVRDIAQRAHAAAAVEVVFHSSHETLLRDGELADSLIDAGFRVLVQSPRAAQMGVDKFLMREFFASSGLSMLRWWRGGTVLSGGDEPRTVVVKSRTGTQSSGLRLSDLHVADAAADEYCEAYADGVEYSVLVYRDDAGDAVLPPVWKGPTSRDLVPPWRRLRLCPDPFGSPEFGAQLSDVGLRTAVEAGVRGWTEVELLVTQDGTTHVLEINPRVCGTMRIAALATRTRLFALHRHPGQRGRLPAVRRAAEIPYTGVPITDPVRSIFGTSRLTVASATYRGVAEVLGPVADPDARGVLAELVARETDQLPTGEEVSIR